MENSRFKFRVWDKKHNEYIPSNMISTLLYFGHKDEFHIEFECFSTFADSLIVEQCTGLKDKNGNLIYENDRVGFYVYGQDEEWHAQQGTVIWYNSCWGIETSSRFIQFENELTIKNPKDIEIIGNIHSQKEQQ